MLEGRLGELVAYKVTHVPATREVQAAMRYTVSIPTGAGMDHLGHHQGRAGRNKGHAGRGAATSLPVRGCAPGRHGIAVKIAQEQIPGVKQGGGGESEWLLALYKRWG